MVTPFNDHLLIELPKSDWVTADDAGEQDDPRAGTGIVVAAPEAMLYLSAYTWIADSSLADYDTLKSTLKLMKSLVGKRVYFEKRADIGNVIEDGDKKYAVIKLTKLTGIDSDET